MFTPPHVVTVWIALDDMDEETGPLSIQTPRVKLFSALPYRAAPMGLSCQNGLHGPRTQL